MYMLLVHSFYNIFNMLSFSSHSISTSIERMLSLIELISIKFQKQFRFNHVEGNCEYERKRKNLFSFGSLCVMFFELMTLMP